MDAGPVELLAQLAHLLLAEKFVYRVAFLREQRPESLAQRDRGLDVVEAIFPYTWGVSSLALSPDGKVLVNTSETTNMAHFIDTDTRKTFDNVLVDTARVPPLPAPTALQLPAGR